MSMVTSAVLVIDGIVPEPVKAALLTPNPEWEDQSFGEHPAKADNPKRQDVDSWFGGHKCSGIDLFAAGLNRVTPDELITFLRSLPWTYACAVLVYSWEGQDPDWDASPQLKPVMINPPIDISGLEKDGPMAEMYARDRARKAAKEAAE